MKVLAIIGILICGAMFTFAFVISNYIACFYFMFLFIGILALTVNIYKSNSL